MKNLSKSMLLLLMSFSLALNPVMSISVHAACSHSWSGYSYYGFWIEDPSSIGKCVVRVTESIRTCSKCGDVDFREVRNQLSHNYVNGMCTNGCGAGYARMYMVE